MAEVDSLEGLQGLHRDLLAFCENRLQDIDRLVEELKDRIEEFRGLLDKKAKNDQSRQKLSTGTFEIDDVQYSVNDDFKQQTVEIADELDLDELDAAKLLLLAQDDSAELDRSPVASAIIRFHKRRQFILECLRLAIKISQDDDIGEVHYIHELKDFKRKVLNVGDGRVENGSKYWQKCFTAMADIEVWLHKLADRSQRASVIGHSLSDEALELLEFENVSLLTQHESLAAISSYLVKDGDGYTYQEDFRKVLAKARLLDKHDLILVHYLPILLTFITRFGQAESASCTVEQALELNKIILAEKENEHWSLRNFHAAVYIWWSAEYFSKYKNENYDAEAKEEAERDRFQKALQEGAFHFMLSIAQDVRKSDWYDPAKVGLVSFLMQDAPVLPSESPKPAEHFQTLLMDQYQNFVDAFITNMPNTLRTLKLEEDNQRRELLSRYHRNTLEYQYHLERFLVLLSFAYEDFPEAALTFWEDPEGNLYGFLQWAAKRQTTPRVAAFCEMLRSISEDEQCANAAHQFLLEEGSPIAGKLRRTGSLSWNQIYAEVNFYASSIKERPAPIQSTDYPAGQTSMDQVVEPESAIMLECYLRLVSHLCKQSSKARFWVLDYMYDNKSSLAQILFELSASNIDSRLRACAFTTLASLLTNKSRSISDPMWSLLDNWISGGASPGSQAVRAPAQSSPSWSEQRIFELIAAHFEEANAFVSFLNALIAPSADDEGLNDALPFPEHLGTTYRMAGIDSYVDFAVGKVFGETSQQLVDRVQLRMLRLNCLDFIATCLSTFNEDLVVVANRSSIPVDSAMRSSSLEAYVRLHPFARVMEWLFNDKVLNSLFASAHQNVDEVNAASADSPFILSLVRSVEVMNLVMKLQATYLDIVRPLIKQSPTRRSLIPHSAIATFEDALINNLHVVVDLGLYCGTGHQELTIASLTLLEKLSSSRKLVVSPSAGFGKYSDRSKLIGVFEKDGEAERVARSLIMELQLDGRELEARQAAPGYVIKTNLLIFLKNCLAALPERPTLAHLLLGFVCRANDLDVSQDGLFAQAASLFHAVLQLALEYPDVGIIPAILPAPGEDANEITQHPCVGQPSYFAWLSNIKDACIEILRNLWRSPLSCVLTMTELRAADYIFIQATRQGIVSPNTLWDGLTTLEPMFLFSDSALALRNFLRQRAAFYDYLARELRVSVKERMTSLRSRLQATLLGSTTFPGVPAVPNPTVFDLFDFMELEVGGTPPLPDFEVLKGLDFEICRVGGPGSASAYDLASAQELLLLRRNELKNSRQLSEDGPDAVKYEEESAHAIMFLLGINQQQELMHAHAETLRYWTQLAVVAVESCDFDQASKTSFVLQIVQLVLPKLERAFSEDEKSARITANTLLRLIQPLMKYVDFEASDKAKSMDFGNDRVFQVFRVALNGIFSPVSDAELRELCYQICHHFLRSTSNVPKKNSGSSRHTLRSVKLAGDRLMDVVCDDAYSGQGTCRVSALLFLDALVFLTNREDSKYMVETFARVNFVGVLVDSIKQMPVDLREAPPGEVPSVLSFYNTSLALLLRVSQTRLGATHVLNAGLFQSIRDSQLFSADPDIGLGIFAHPFYLSSQTYNNTEMDNPTALAEFFSLMLAVLSIINAVILARGQNDQTVKLARDFLNENRLSMVSVFKRHASIGGLKIDGKIDLGDLVDCYTLLISATGFLEYEDMSKSQREPLRVFS